MKTICTFLTLLFFVTAAHGQVKFHKSFLGSCNVGTVYIQQCSDSGYVVGSSTCFGIYVIRTNSLGDTLWTHNYNDTSITNPTYAVLNSIRELSNGSFMIAGKYMGNGYFMRIDSTGNMLWSNIYSEDQVTLYNTIEQDTGGFLINGYNNGPMGHDDAFYLSVNDSGSIHSIAYQGATSTGVLNFVRTLDGGIITSFNGITKMGGSSTTFWHSISDYPSVIIQEPDSDYLYASYTSIVKLDTHGNQLWRTNPGVGIIRDMVYADDPSSPGYAIISMDTSARIDDNDMKIYLTKTDTSGSVLWTKSFEIFLFTGSCNLVFTKDKGFAFTGISTGISENQAILIYKTDSAGNTQ